MKKNNTLNHIAIIMDGNGRWAESQGLDRIEGHKQGVNSVRKIIRYADKICLKHLTLFTFSEENWNRPKIEVLSLMKLLVQSLNKELQSLIDNNVRFRAIGNLNRLDLITREAINKAEKSTSSNTGLNLNLAISYSGRQEIVDACNKIIEYKKDSISIDEFPQFLYSQSLPDPDLLIRTAGENRISNFLLWQIAYAEIYVSNLYWPEFNSEELDKAVENYYSRERKFGRISSDV